jgi:hypothetical protein
MNNDLITNAKAKREEAEIRVAELKAAFEEIQEEFRLAQHQFVKWDELVKQVERLQVMYEALQQGGLPTVVDRMPVAQNVESNGHTSQKVAVKKGTLAAWIARLLRENQPQSVSMIAQQLQAREQVQPGPNLKTIVRSAIKRREELFTESPPNSGAWRLATEDFVEIE